MRAGRRLQPRQTSSYTCEALPIRRSGGRRHSMRTGVAILAGLLIFAVQAGPATARSLDDCEKIKDWHAYNTCLASFGPRRGQRTVTGQPQADGPEGRVYGRGAKQAERRAAGRAVPGLSVQRVAGGRVRATFDVSGPRRASTR